jgi:YD repeat-containing protein
MAIKTVYDSVGRVKSTIFLGDGSAPAVTLSSTSYDAAGRVWQSTDANNNTTTYAYDDAGRRVSVTQPATTTVGPTTTRYSYDANGNLRFVTDAKNRITEHVYDALNRRINTILPAARLDVNGDGLFGSDHLAVVAELRY